MVVDNNFFKYMTTNLTKRQRQILDFITEFVEREGYAPSLREIGKHFKLSSPATVHVHIDNLKKKGFLKTSYNEARSIERVPAEINFAAIELPLAGLIQCLLLLQLQALVQDFCTIPFRHVS